MFTVNLDRIADVNKPDDLGWAALLSLAYKRTGIGKYVDHHDIRNRAHDFPVLRIANNIKKIT